MSGRAARGALLAWLADLLSGIPLGGASSLLLAAPKKAGGKKGREKRDREESWAQRRNEHRFTGCDGSKRCSGDRKEERSCPLSHGRGKRDRDRGPVHYSPVCVGVLESGPVSV